MGKTELILVYDETKENLIFLVTLNQYSHENIYPSDHELLNQGSSLEEGL